MLASIHQPSTSTFALFDRLLLLSEGRTCYAGPLSAVEPHFAALGLPTPLHTNQAEFLLELVNIDFAEDRETARARLQMVHLAWAATAENATSCSRSSDEEGGVSAVVLGARPRRSAATVPLTLLHRNFIKSYRDVVAYGIRIAMYMGQCSVYLSEDTTLTII